MFDLNAIPNERKACLCCTRGILEPAREGESLATELKRFFFVLLRQGERKKTNNANPQTNRRRKTPCDDEL